MLSPMGLRLTRRRRGCVHIDEGFDFLGFRIQRQSKRGLEQGVRLHLAIEEVTFLDHGQGEGDPQTGNEQPTLRPPAPTQRGSAGLDNYFRHGVSRTTFPYLAPVHLATGRAWLRQNIAVPTGMVPAALPGQRWWPEHEGEALFHCRAVSVDSLPLPRQGIPTPWDDGNDPGRIARPHGLVESRMRWKLHVRFGGTGRGDGPQETPARRPGPIPLGHRGPRRGAPRGVATSPRGRLGPARHGPQRIALRLVEEPEDLTENQERKLAWIAKVNAPLYRAYLLKEQLREIVNVKGRKALRMLDAWLMWTARCRIPAFVELGRRVRKNRAGIEASLRHNLSNAAD